MNIVYAFTADYAPKAFPSMRSLKEHNPKAKVFVVTEADELDLPIEADKVAAFPIRYNECFATGETDSPAIVHYCGYINWFNNDAVPRMEYIKKWL